VLEPVAADQRGLGAGEDPGACRSGEHEVGMPPRRRGPAAPLRQAAAAPLYVVEPLLFAEELAWPRRAEGLG
jgi:hypothetical protein